MIDEVVGVLLFSSQEPSSFWEGGQLNAGADKTNGKTEGIESPNPSALGVGCGH